MRISLPIQIINVPARGLGDKTVGNLKVAAAKRDLSLSGLLFEGCAAAVDTVVDSILAQCSRNGRGGERLRMSAIIKGTYDREGFALALQKGSFLFSFALPPPLALQLPSKLHFAVHKKEKALFIHS